jgi:hypothetical protein
VSDSPAGPLAGSCAGPRVAMGGCDSKDHDFTSPDRIFVYSCNFSRSIEQFSKVTGIARLLRLSTVFSIHNRASTDDIIEIFHGEEG